MSRKKRRTEEDTPPLTEAQEDDEVCLSDSDVVVLDDTILSIEDISSVECEDSSVEATVTSGSDTEAVEEGANLHTTHTCVNYTNTARSDESTLRLRHSHLDGMGREEETMDCMDSTLIGIQDSISNISASSHHTIKDFDNSVLELSDYPVTLDASDEEYEEYVMSEPEESSESDEEVELSSDVPLYSHAKITVDDSMLAILTFVIRHNLSSTCVSDLLKLIMLHLPMENQMKSSMYFFRKHFSKLNVPVKYHVYCSQCYTELIDKAVCPNGHINADKSFFIEIALISQLQSLFKKRGFCESTQHRFSRKKVKAENIEDVYDGQLYREAVECGFLSEVNKYNISFMWNSDGVPVFKSSQSSLWPVYFSINELPFKIRHRKENILLGGLWFGRKPHGNLLLEPLISPLKEIRRGFYVDLPDCDSPVKVQGILLCGTCDLPAKSMFMGMVQYNGAWGCQVCKIKGESVTIEPPKKKEAPREIENNQARRTSVWVYKYTKEIELRQHAETISLGEQAYQLMLESQQEQNVLGVKGPCVLSKIMVDVIRGTAIDVMHSGFLGVVKKILDLLFNSKFKNEAWSLHEAMSTLDKRLLKICPPNFVQRKIRSLTQYSHWKASELKSWIYYYCLPVLQDYLPPIYLENLIDLISSLYTLNSSSITPEDLISCGILLDRFVCTFEKLYGVRHMSMNIHLMLHLTFAVTNLGPLWSSSCFPFENLNGLLLRMIHGTRYVETQLANCAYLVLNLPYALESVQSDVVRQCCLNFLHPSSKLKKLEVINSSTFSVGVHRQMSTIPHCLRETLLLDEDAKVKCQSFLRLKKGDLLFVARSYTRTLKSVSYVVSFEDNSVRRFGLIDKFLRISNCECIAVCACKLPATFFALIEVIEVKQWRESISFMYCYKALGTFAVIPIHNLEAMFFSISIENNNFLCEPVNFLEAE